ncbi:MAG: YfhO family protein [Myxococcales bacterium]|nr:YfhO family protein [Myxococcales bacterium]
MSRRWALWLSLAGALALVHRHLLRGELLAGRDGFRIFMPEAAYLAERLSAFELPLWTSSVRLGQPFAATLYSQVFYPPHLLCVIAFGPGWGVNLQAVLHGAVAAGGAYLIARRLGARPASAALAGGGFAFSLLLTRLAEYQNLFAAASWSGFVLAAALAVARAPGRRSAGWLALALGASVLSGSPETTLWQVLLAMGFLVAARRRVRAGLLLGGSLLLGSAIGALVLIPGAELVLQWRAPSALPDQLEWSVSFHQLLSMAWPLADHPREGYWGKDQWFLTSLFIGSLCSVLAILTLTLSRKRERGVPRKLLPFLIGGLLFLALSLGENFAPSRWLLALPPLSLFRYPVKYAVGAAFCASVLSAFGLERIAAWARSVRPSPRRAAIALASTVALAMAGVPLVRWLPLRAGAQSGFFWFSLALGAAAVAFFAVPGGIRRPARVRLAIAAAALIELGLAHLLLPSAGYATTEELFAPSRLAEAVRAGPHGRLSVQLPDAEVRVADSRQDLVLLRHLEEGLRTVEGYGGREPYRLDVLLEGRPRAAYDLLGVSHFVREGAAPFPDLALAREGMREVRLYRSDTALPRAFVVHRSVVSSDAEALSAARSAEQPFRKTAFLADGEPIDVESDCTSTAALVEPRPEHLEVEVDACARGYLVVTDQHYPGWTATVDGEEAPLQRADYLLRAVEVPKGKHQVVMRYRPASFAMGLSVSAVALGVAMVLLLRRSRRT